MAGAILAGIFFIVALWGLEQVHGRLPVGHPLAGLGGELLLGILLAILFMAACGLGAFSF